MECGVEAGGGASTGILAKRSTMLNVPTGAEGAAGVPPPITQAAYAPPDTDQAQFEADKRAVYKHPLFPLLALLFERCELATQSSDTQSSDAFNLDIQAFVQHQERDRKPFLANEPEIDGLMIKAIQVLRIHLLELEKVQELCKDFCNRYITCLKGKMQSENLLRSDYTQGPGVMSGLENNNNNMLSHGNSESGSDSNSPIQYTISPTQQQQQQGVNPPGVLNTNNTGGSGSSTTTTTADCLESRGSNAGMLAEPCIDSLAIHPPTVVPPTTTPTQPYTSPANALYCPPGAQPPAPVGGAYDPHIVHGSTPLGQIGANVCPAPIDPTIMSGQLSPAPTTPGGSADDCDSDFTGRIGSKKQKRGVLPKHATSVMRSWLFQHLVHPYPTEDEKRHIAAQTNLTLLQVNNWFINARRRILQPMLDAGAPGSDSGASGTLNTTQKNSSHRRKSHSGSNRRFWPQDIASLQPQLTSGVLSSSDEESYSSDGEDGDLVIDSSIIGASGGSGGPQDTSNGHPDTQNSYSPESDQP